MNHPVALTTATNAGMENIALALDWPWTTMSYVLKRARAGQAAPEWRIEAIESSAKGGED